MSPPFWPWHPRAAIDRYLTAELPERGHSRLFAHLRQCPDCRRYFDAGVVALRALRAPGAPDPFEEARLARRVLSGAFEAQPDRPRPLRIWAGAAVTAALALAVVFGWSLRTRTVGTVAVAGEELRINGERVSPGASIPRDALVVAAKGDALLELEGDRDVVLRAGGVVRVDQGGALVTLEAGRARFEVRRSRPDVPNPFEVLAKNLRVSVQGTIFVVERREGGGALVAVKEGHVRVRSAHNEVDLTDNQEAVVAQGIVSPPRPASDASLVEDRTDFLERLRKGLRRILRNIERALKK